MNTKRVVCGLVLTLGAVLAVVPAAAADKSDVVGRAAKESFIHTRAGRLRPAATRTWWPQGRYGADTRCRSRS